MMIAWLEKLAPVSAVLVFLGAASAPDPAAPPPAQPEPAPPPAAVCGVELALAGAVPAPAPGAKAAERAWLRNLAPHPLELEGFALRSGRRRLALSGVLAAGGRLDLTPPRLRNREGHLALEDPCGIVLSTLSWDEVGYGEPVLHPAERVGRGVVKQAEAPPDVGEMQL